MPRLPARTARLVSVLDDNGWILVSFERGFFRYTHPLCAQEHPTPLGVRHWYDFDTYQPVRQVLFTSDAHIISVRTGVPWLGSSERIVSLPKATRFIEEEFTP